MLTKEQKQLWLNALNSGKYTRGTKTLFNPTTKKHCCLGVLVDALSHTNPELQIDVTGSQCTVNGKELGYMPIRELLGDTRELWAANDSVSEENNPKYACVLPLIEGLPTSD